MKHHMTLGWLAAMIVLCGCTSETTEPIGEPPRDTQMDAACTSLDDAGCGGGSALTAGNDTALLELAGTCDPITPPGCYRGGQESAVITSVIGSSSWFKASSLICPEGTEVWLCDGCMLRPGNCLDIGGGQPQVGGNIMKTFCCFTNDESVPSCIPTSPPSPDINCPSVPGSCYDGVCLAGHCGLTYAWHNGTPCTQGVCDMKSDNGPMLCGP